MKGNFLQNFLDPIAKVWGDSRVDCHKYNLAKKNKSITNKEKSSKRLPKKNYFYL